MKVCFLFLLFLRFRSFQLPYPLSLPQNNGSFDSYWDGPQGQKGFWGQLPALKDNVFNSDWQDKGVNQIYNINSVAPFAQDRGTGYDSMVPYYVPFNKSSNQYYPVLKQYRSDGQVDPQGLDPSEQNYNIQYDEYFNFFNKNLEKLREYYDKQSAIDNESNTELLKKKYPDSFAYNQYFDGYDQKYSLPGSKTERLNFGRERFLKQQEPFKDIKKVYEEDEANKFLLQRLNEQEKNIQDEISKLQSELYLKNQQ